jgi:hypothetical protein
MGKRLNTASYTGRWYYQNLNWWIFLVGGAWITEPPDWSLNNITPPLGYTLDYHFDTEELLLNLPVIHQRLVKVLIEFSSPMSMGCRVCRNFFIAGSFDYTGGGTVNIWNYLKNNAIDLKLQDNVMFTCVRLIDPLTGFHSIGVVNYFYMNQR